MRQLLFLPMMLLAGCQSKPGGPAGGRTVAADNSDPVSYDWSFREDTIRSEMDDVTRRINQSVLLMGEVSAGDSTIPATIAASCRKGELSVVINLGAERESGTEVRFRVDTAAPELMRYPAWNIPDEGAASGFAFTSVGYAEEFLKTLEAANWLRLEYQPSAGLVPSTVRFKVAGLSEVMPKVHAACAEVRRTADSVGRAHRQAVADQAARAEAIRVAERERRDSLYRASHQERLNGQPTDPHPASLPWMLDTRTKAYYRTDCEAAKRIPVPSRQFF